MNSVCDCNIVSEIHCCNTLGKLSIEAKKAEFQCNQEKACKEAEDASKLPALEAAYTAILQGLGEDTARQGLLRTPLRAAKAMQFLTKGYNENICGE